MLHRKLVRDKIPEIIRADGLEPIIETLDDSEYKVALEKKLTEEHNEVLEASGADRLEELADLLEVIKALAELEGASLEDVIKIADQKVEKRGAFKQKIFLEEVK